MGTLCKPDSFQYTEEEAAALSQKELDAMREDLIARALELYQSKDAIFGEEQMREVERAVLLRTVDEKWMDHIDAMDDLRDSISLNAYAQRNPINEYRITGMQMFEEMVADIRDTTSRRLLSVVPQEKVVRVQTAKPLETSGEGNAPVRGKVARTSNGVQIGRNSPCPCGSGKRYKRCCGAGKGEN